MRTLPSTRSIPLALAAAAANITATSLTAPAAAANLPAAAMRAADNTLGANHVYVIPVGVGSDNQTGNVQVVGWSWCEPAGLWVPTVLFRCDYTVSAFTFAATVGGSPVTFRAADTFGTPTVGTANVDYVITTGLADTPSAVVVDLKGNSHYTVETARGTLGTSANALHRGL